MTAWVHRALHWRLASYRYALERLVISVPSRLAVEAERALKRFEAIVRRRIRRWRAAPARSLPCRSRPLPIVTK